MTIPSRLRLLGRALILTVAIAAAVEGPRAQTDDPGTTAVVERATKYVMDYLDAFSALVCEEQQVQTLMRPDGTTVRRRRLTSDFLLVKTSPDAMSIFRDVIEVDGRKVRNREDRLRRLFLGSQKSALEQAQAIAKESARYNIGLSRTGNSPLLPLAILTTRKVPGFQFTLTDRTLAFKEFRSPSVLRQKSSNHVYDLMSTGSFAIDPDTGRVLSAELTASGPPPTVSAAFTVRYAEDAKLALLVPTEVKERYWRSYRPREEQLEAVSSYTNFRRFQVTTAEQIKK